MQQRPTQPIPQHSPQAIFLDTVRNRSHRFSCLLRILA